MATKLEVLKKEIGFTKDGPSCGNCVHFTFVIEKRKSWNNIEYPVEKNLRCSKGGFKVGKSCWCLRYERKVDVTAQD